MSNLVTIQIISCTQAIRSLLHLSGHQAVSTPLNLSSSEYTNEIQRDRQTISRKLLSCEAERVWRVAFIRHHDNKSYSSTNGSARAVSRHLPCTAPTRIRDPVHPQDNSEIIHKFGDTKMSSLVNWQSTNQYPGEFDTHQLRCKTLRNSRIGKIGLSSRWSENTKSILHTEGHPNNWILPNTKMYLLHHHVPVMYQ